MGGREAEAPHRVQPPGPRGLAPTGPSFPAQRPPRAGVTCLLLPDTPARSVTSASAVPPALGPQRPHTARLSGGTRCLSSARQALLHLYDQVFFFCIKWFCWEGARVIPDLLLDPDSRVDCVFSPPPRWHRQAGGDGAGADTSGRPRSSAREPCRAPLCLFFHFLCSGRSGVCGENVLARTSRVLETATAAV